MFGLYIHIPFCKKKCIYCDFVTVITKNKDYLKEYLECIKKELPFRMRQNVKIKTLYIGGGTPSIIGEELIHELIDEISTYTCLSEIKEITIEANPEDITNNIAKTMKKIGITRVSLGIQSMNKNDLETLSRINSPEDNEKAIKTLQDNGIVNINCDIIFDIPNSSEKNLVETLKKLTRLDIPHISAYGLTVEENTPIHLLLKRGKIKLKDNFKKEFKLIHEFLSENGYIHYEISNYSKPGFQSIHNLIYWNREEYIGIGVSACGFVNKKRYQNETNVKKYKEKLSQNILPSMYEEKIDNTKEFEEIVMLGFRKNDGFPIENIKKLLNQNQFHKFQQKLELFKNVYLKIQNNRIIPTLKGWIFSDYIVRELINV